VSGRARRDVVQVTRFERQRLQSPQSPVRALAIGAGMSALASTPAIAADKLSTATAAQVYVVAVVAAARLGGFVAGASASLLSFLPLNYFFTPPLGTFNVDKAEDLVALVVFVGVAILVGGLVSRRLPTEREARSASCKHASLTKWPTGFWPGSRPRPCCRTSREPQ
jgi:two-component system sensor histidine kinase KdpD